MSKRKTKKQKKISQLKRQLEQARFQSYQKDIIKDKNEEVKIKKEKVSKERKSKKTKNTYQLSSPQVKNFKKIKKTEIFLYNPNLIKKDLKKTLILTLFFLLIIGVIYYLWELNGLSYLQSLL